LIGDVHAATPVLLLRPLAGTMSLWGSCRDELARRHPIIACNHRGVGSSPPAGVATSTRTMARDAADLLDHLGVRAHVFGLSLGGMVATWLAIDRPDLVNGLVVASAPARGTSALRGFASPRVSSAERGVRFVASLARRAGEREAGLAEQVLSARFRTAEPARTAQILDQLRSDGGSLRVVLQHAAAAALHDASYAVTHIRTPTLCIAGALDDLVPPAAIAELARAIPNARFDVIPDAGHDLSLEAPLELARRVSSFYATLHN
jgi:3-oxoadipate enol-lactonase